MAERELDELRDEPPPNPDALLNTTEATEPATPVKRGRGRPKGSKNKKTLEAEQSGSTSAQTGEKRKRGRPPKNQDAAAAEKPPPKKRGRPPKNAKKDADAEGDNDDGNEAKRLKSDEGITV